jgi:hypothetical protein
VRAAAVAARKWCLRRRFSGLARPQTASPVGDKVVPGERIELPTNGLQNRCSTAELTRHSLEVQPLYRLRRVNIQFGDILLPGALPGLDGLGRREKPEDSTATNAGPLSLKHCR